MKQFWFLISLLLLLFGYHSSVQAGDVIIGYDDLARYVKNQNQMVQSKENDVISQKAEIGYLTKSFLPDITAVGGAQTYQSGRLSRRTEPMVNVTATLNIFKSGRDLLKSKINKDKLAIAKLNLKNEYLKQLTEARYLFSTCAFYKSQIHSLKNILFDLNKLQRQTQTKFKSGLIPASELDAIQIFADQMRSEFILIEDNYEHSVDELKVALGIPVRHNIQLESLQKHEYSNFESRSFKNHPSLKALQKEKNIADKKKTQHALWWTPSIDLYGTYDIFTFPDREFSNMRDRDQYTAGVQIKMNIFDRLLSSSKSKSSKYKAKALKNKMVHLDQKLEALVKKLNHGLDLRHELIHQSRKTLNLSQKNLSALKVDFQDGIKNSSDIISAYETLKTSNEKYNEYKTEYRKIEANLLALTESE